MSQSMAERARVIKVLHQPHSIAQYHPTAKQDILWPCLRFALSLQAKAKQSLNLFESTLLCLLADGGDDIALLSRQMGLEIEDGQGSSLAEFLSLKLQQLQLINERLELTPKGEEAVANITNAKTQVVGATVYFDPINRCWLPMVSRGELQPLHVELTPEGLAEYVWGSVGQAQQIKARPLLIADDARQAPTEREVIEIIQRSRQQHKKLGMYAAGSGGDGYLTREGTISVNPDPELVYLHCHAFMVAGGQSPYVSDGFLPTTQSRFTRGFNDLKKHQSYPLLKAARDAVRNKSRRSHQRSFLVPSRSLSSLYQKLVDSKVSNATEQSEYKQNLYNFIDRSYAELEMMLAKCYSFSRLKNSLSELSTDPHQNAELGVELATQLGFKAQGDKLVKGLLRTNKGSIKHLKADQPVMSPLLLCHLLAARNDPQQPMAQLAQAQPELLGKIALLRRWRNPIAHGDSEEVVGVIGSYEVEFINQFVEQVRQTLTSWLKITDGRVPEQKVPNWHKDDQRNRAAEKLEQCFGLMSGRMERAVYQGLFDSLVLANLEDARGRTNNLAAALQHALYQACQALDANQARDIETVKRQLSNLGSEEVVTSNPHKVRTVLGGGNATLGANFIAFWAQITDEQQQELQQIKELVKTVDQLIRIRGHSGPVLGKHAILDQVEKAVFKLIKRLMEQYCG